LPAGRYFSSELNLFGLRADQLNGKSFNRTWGGGLDLNLYPLTRNAVIAPFVAIGSGEQYEDRDRPQRGYLFLTAGGGFLANLTADGRTALRVDAKRYRVNDYELVPGRNNLWDTRISAGLQVAFGNDPLPPPPPPPPAPPAAPMDSDRDGVPDDIDQCPNTPFGVQVDAVGCPLPPPPPPAPLDSDQDGVLDINDACPGTPLGMKVDDHGCAIKSAKIVLHDINFEFGKAVLTSDAKLALDKVLEGLRGQPGMKLAIEGHTDSVGSAKANLTLSKKRANAAKVYMVESGIEGSRLTTQGFGKSKPIASNKNAAGRAENRRVEFKVTQQ
jgi:outer membrane protein OmpA-like peptidoglycan-associated protein